MNTSSLRFASIVRFPISSKRPGPYDDFENTHAAIKGFERKNRENGDCFTLFDCPTLSDPPTTDTVVLNGGHASEMRQFVIKTLPLTVGRDKTNFAQYVHIAPKDEALIQKIGEMITRYGQSINLESKRFASIVRFPVSPKRPGPYKNDFKNTHAAIEAFEEKSRKDGDCFTLFNCPRLLDPSTTDTVVLNGGHASEMRQFIKNLPLTVGRDKTGFARYVYIAPNNKALIQKIREMITRYGQSINLESKESIESEAEAYQELLTEP